MLTSELPLTYHYTIRLHIQQPEICTHTQPNHLHMYTVDWTHEQQIADIDKHANTPALREIHTKGWDSPACFPLLWR